MAVPAIGLLNTISDSGRRPLLGLVSRLIHVERIGIGLVGVRCAVPHDDHEAAVTQGLDQEPWGQRLRAGGRAKRKRRGEEQQAEWFQNDLPRMDGRARRVLAFSGILVRYRGSCRRQKMKKTALALLAGLALSAAALAQQDYSKVEIKTTQLSETTYMMVGAGGNLGLSVGEDAVFLIDDEFAELSPKITAAIAKITTKPLRFVMNTHWHFDHTGGNENFGRAGALIVMGDTYFNGMYPFIDTSSGGTVEGVIAAVDQVLGIAADQTKIIPGHGPLSNKAELQAYRDMLATVSGRIRQMIAEGRKLEDITASKVTADFDEKWGKGFIPANKFAEMIAMNLLRNR
jgi:glyoxylase-like metal-dependent hydrolase (beta-lactamase superfamily II)